MARAPHQRARTGFEVRKPAEPALRVRGGLGHHLGVEAEPGHDHEHVTVPAPADLRHPDVDVAVAAPQGDPDRPFGFVEHEVEVAGEEIPRAHRDDPHGCRRSGERRGDRADRAVPAGGDDDVDPGFEGLVGGPFSGVLEGGLEDERGAHPSNRQIAFAVAAMFFALAFVGLMTRAAR